MRKDAGVAGAGRCERHGRNTVAVSGNDRRIHGDRSECGIGRTLGVQSLRHEGKGYRWQSYRPYQQNAEDQFWIPRHTDSTESER